jgi:hypothetical protein
MRQLKLWLMAAILTCGFLTTSCEGVVGESDNPSAPSRQEIEKSLVGLWFDEAEYSGILEDTGEPFTSVVLAMQVNADHTGCLYVGAFDKGDYDNPLAVYGGPEEAGFTWQLDGNGEFVVMPTASAGTRGDGTEADDLRQLASVNGWEEASENGQTVLQRGSNTLTPANYEQTAIIMNMVKGETFTICTVNADGMPKEIVFIDVNTEGPGEEYSPAIAKFLLDKKFDMIFTQENFNYHAQLAAPFDEAGYLHDVWGGGIDANLAVKRLLDGEELEGILHVDGLTAFWSPKLKLVREDSVRWTAGYGLMDHGWDTMVRKGFRSYDVTLKGGNHVVVYNMHMDASSEDDEAKELDGPDRRARMVQWRQLRDHILAHLDERPVIVTGDLNSYYERDSICSQVFSIIEESGRATVGDAWITLERGGKFPDMVKGPVMNDPGSTTWALKGQTLDKIIYINPKDGPKLKPLSVSVDSTTYVRPDGKTPLGDHAPVSAKFRYLPR